MSTTTAVATPPRPTPRAGVGTDPATLDALAPRRRRRRPSATGLSVNGLLILGSAYMVLPIVWLFFAATKNNADLYGTPGFAFGRMSLWSNIGSVLGEANGVFLRWMLNSLLYSGSVPSSAA
ncbi:hypothetical protein [Tessaracoccus aquimaris]|uniref:hypothetical protein n=1 Tax=Tessaracoccus aquimaris TaxID=1332264 RepID=UPI001D044264|nr:hypothetical protein [Tessaracoccus aquimaris]